MQQKLINLSPDLKKLRDEGYEIEVYGGHLIVHHIPYVNTNRQISYGKLVVQLSLNNNITIAPSTHVIHFMGDDPCHSDGTIISAIQHASLNQRLNDSVVMNLSFSNKPPNGYTDYYHQITTYANIISAPAQSLDKTATARTFKVIESSEDENVFNYYDTNSSRANIYNLTARLRNQRIAIIGLGGTGAYILDFVAKTPVAEICLFDGDVLLQHNAFRFPGAASIEDLNKQQTKVNYLANKYSRIHKVIIPCQEYITEANLEKLNGMSYVFVCVDDNVSKKVIIDHLLVRGITFFDSGLGVNLVDDSLIGTIRLTTGTQNKNDHIAERVSFGDDGSNEYSTNIQIAELNAFNAVFAVMKWKKMSGVYQDLEQEHHTTYSINVSQLLNEETTA